MTDVEAPTGRPGVDFESVTGVDLDVQEQGEPVTSLDVVASDNTGDIIEHKHFVEAVCTSNYADDEKLNRHAESMIASMCSVSPTNKRFTAAHFQDKAETAVVSDLKRSFSDAEQTKTDTSAYSLGYGSSKRVRNDFDETSCGEVTMSLNLNQDRSTLEETEFFEDTLLSTLEVSFEDETERQVALFLGELRMRWPVPVDPHGGTEGSSQERGTDSPKRKDFNCLLCGLRLGSSNSLKHHEMRHTNAFPHWCQHCGKGFALKSKLKAHTYTHTGTSPFSCNQCGKSFNSRSSLRRHERIHLTKPFPVTFPPTSLVTEATEEITFKDQGNILAHVAVQSSTSKIRTSSMVKPFQCHICENRFNKNVDLQRHALIHSGVCFRCDVCGEFFGDKSNMLCHRLIHGQAKSSRGEACGGLLSDSHVGGETATGVLSDSHVGGETATGVLSDSDKLEGKGLFDCTLMETAEELQGGANLELQNQTSDFTTQGPIETIQGLIQPSQGSPHTSTSINDSTKIVCCSTLKDPGTIHSCKHLQACPVCGKILVHPNICAESEQNQTEQIRPLSCQTSGAQFSSPSSLRRHQEVETGGDLFKCDVCSRVFAQARYLQAHVRIHTGEKPYVCPICSCPFRRASNLSRHKKVHAQDRPYKCTACDRSFLRTSDLVKHELMHKDIPDFACDICGIGHTSNRLLQKHRKRHIGGKSVISGDAYRDRGGLTTRMRKKHVLEMKAGEAGCQVPPEVFLEEQIKQEFLRSD